jgi:hypothetical protein
LIIGVIVGGYFYYLSVAPIPPVKYAYTTGETAEFVLINGTSLQAITSTTGITVQVFNPTDTPLAYLSTVTPEYPNAMYSSTASAWQILGLSAGSYLLVVSGTKLQPTSVTVTLPGTNDNTKPVSVTPSAITVYVTPTITNPQTLIANYTASYPAGALSVGPTASTAWYYTTSTPGLNGTYTGNGKFAQGRWWSVTWYFSVSGSTSSPAKFPTPIDIWFPTISTFSYTACFVDGVSCALTQVTTSTTASGGYAGYYAVVSTPWSSGQSHTVTLYITDTNPASTIQPTASGSLTCTIAGNFGVLNTVYRTWTDYATTAIVCKNI